MESIEIEEKTTENYFLKCYKEDKDFILGNESLEQYLVFKYKIIPKRQEDFLGLVTKELKEIVEKL